MNILSNKYSKYPQYFSPEIKPFINEKWFPIYNPFDDDLKNSQVIKEIMRELPNNFNYLRKIGENESYLSEMIRNDSVDD